NGAPEDTGHLVPEAQSLGLLRVRGIDESRIDEYLRTDTAVQRNVLAHVASVAVHSAVLAVLEGTPAINSQPAKGGIDRDPVAVLRYVQHPRVHRNRQCALGTDTVTHEKLVVRGAI